MQNTMQKIRLLLQKSKKKARFFLSEFDPAGYRIVLVFHKARHALAYALQLQREVGNLKMKSKRLSEVRGLVLILCYPFSVTMLEHPH